MNSATDKIRHEREKVREIKGINNWSLSKGMPGLFSFPLNINSHKTFKCTHRLNRERQVML